MLLPLSPSPNFREVHAELSRNFRKKLRYNPGFPASATYEGSHSIEAGLRETSARKHLLSRHHRETFAKPSLSMMVVLLCKFPYTDLSVNHHIHIIYTHIYMYMYWVKQDFTTSPVRLDSILFYDTILYCSIVYYIIRGPSPLSWAIADSEPFEAARHPKSSAALGRKGAIGLKIGREVCRVKVQDCQLLGHELCILVGPHKLGVGSRPRSQD